MGKVHLKTVVLVAVIALALPTAFSPSLIAPSTVRAVSSTVFSDDFSGDVPGQSPAGWIARGDSQITPTVQEIGGIGPQYRELSFPDGSGSLDKWELVDNHTLTVPYTVTVKQRFLIDVADRAGITIGWKDATLDRIDIQPNVYFDDIEFRTSSAIGSNVTVSGPATVNGGLPVAGNTDYWMRVSTSLTSTGDGQVVVSWSTDGTNFTPVLTAVGPSLAGNALTGLVGVGTAGPHLPPTLFDDFQVVSAIPVPTAPTITAVTPTGGSLAGGTPITITGTGFVAGASVTTGGTAATNVVVNGTGTSITAITGAHGAGTVNVVVNNPDKQSATLSNGYTYSRQVPGPKPSITLDKESPTLSNATRVGLHATLTPLDNGTARLDAMEFRATVLGPRCFAYATPLTVSVISQGKTVWEGTPPLLRFGPGLKTKTESERIFSTKASSPVIVVPGDSYIKMGFASDVRGPAGPPDTGFNPCAQNLSVGDPLQLDVP